MTNRAPFSLSARALRWLIRLGTLSLFGVGSAWATNDVVQFSRGALIIPEQAVFQTPCGAISGYGLVWKILQSNSPGHYNAAHPVTVYLVINGGKSSPNRCVTSNRTPAPTPSAAGPSGASNHWDDPKWNDGCDIRINNLAEQPAVPVNYALPWPASGVYPDARIPTIDTTNASYTYSSWYISSASVARPGLSQSTPLDNSGTGSSRFTTVQYLGAPFVIDAPDAANVIGFLQSGDAFTSIAELQQFTTACACSSSPYGNVPSPSCHYVQMHQATHNFSAPVGRRFNKIPSKIALLDTGAGVQYYPHTTLPLRVLDGYLQNAGIYRSGTVNNTDSGGCPPGTTSGCTINGGQPGTIYDQFNSYADLVTTGTNPRGLLNAVDGTGKPLYSILWTPHWDVNNSIAGRVYTGGDCTTGGQPQCQGSSNYTSVAPWPPSPDIRANAMDNITYFLNQRGTGLMGECSAIEAYEGSTTGATTTPPVTAQTNFLFTGPVQKNAIGANWDGWNCTDPDYLASPSPRPNCVVYQHVDSPFAQIGDFHYVTQGGAVSSFGPSSSPASNYQPGVARLLVSWSNYSVGANTSAPPSGNNGWDLFDFGFVGNNPQKGAVVYVGGHEQIQPTVGNRLILNTLLNLDWLPVGNERALSAPIAFIDNNPGTSDALGNKSLLFAGTYLSVAAFPADPSFVTFRYDMGSHWIYPHIAGHFRTHSLVGGSTLAAGESNLDQFTLWDAAGLLSSVAPSTRNLFTYFGGYVTTGQPGPHGLRQIGWRPEIVSGTALPTSCPQSPCVDVMKWSTDAGGRLILVPGADGICDIEQALYFTPIDPTQDLSGSCSSTNATNLMADVPKVQSMLQVVRGYCFSTTTQLDGSVSSNPPRLTPTGSQCNNPVAPDSAQLDGIVHSTPAVVPPSRNIDIGPNPRPTVTYVGGYGGQLHAFYVSGGSRYTGPATTVSLPPGNLPANSSRAGTSNGNVFSTDWASLFAAGTTPAPGTELWSFIPASQLSGLQGNNARVDSSPIYMDVFIDIAGSGIREWHTVLVGSVGPTGNELFAMDVSNPLKPVLMWDLVGSVFQWGPGYPGIAGTTLANSAIGGTFEIEWVNTTALYRFSPAADPGRLFTGVYDYSDLGASVGTSMGQMRFGLAPLYGVFVASNASGPTGGGLAKGLEVFALDVATGQKVWQFEQPYTQTFVPNAVPVVVSLITGPDGVNRVYVGDAEGRIWELDAGTGVNLTNANDICANPPCNYAAFDTQSTATNPQPITTNIAVAKIPRIPDPGSAFVNYPSAMLLLFGTSGANWVPANVSGIIHAAFEDLQYRVPYRTGGWNLARTVNWTPAAARSYASTYGVLQEISPGLPHTFAAGERLFGAITVAGVKAYFATANGPVPNDINLLDGRTTGATYYLDLQSASPTAPIGTLPVPSFANYGGVTVFHNPGGGDDIIGLEVSRISKTTDTSGKSAPTVSLSPTGQGGLIYYLKSWIQRYYQ
jgi:type IV pilus assembly protein PilY1